MSELHDFERLFSITGKTALVTGGSRGLGLHMATALLRAGASLVVVSSRKLDGETGITQAVERLNALPGIAGRAVGVAANAGSSESIRELVAQVKVLLQGRGLDILVCNAGASWGSRFEDAPPHASTKMLDLNVRGVFELVQQALPLLETGATQADPARVVIVSSTSGRGVPPGGANSTIMYAASKAAASHLGRNLAVELGPRHITVNSIAPGFFPSKLASGLMDRLGGADALGRGNPLGRLGVPEDLAGVLLFLTSMAGRYVNGEDIAVDGGAHLQSGKL